MRVDKTPQKVTLSETFCRVIGVVMPPQPIKQLIGEIDRLATPQACLFTPDDLRALLPNLSDSAFRTLLSRAAKNSALRRVCRGLYIYERAKPDRGRLLYAVVNKLRPLSLNYLSLESVLSDAGVISQILINRITVMSSGRSNIIDCGPWGSVEFVHTRQKPSELVGQLVYDTEYGLWRATVPQALRDMKVTQRNLDLIDLSIADDFV